VLYFSFLGGIVEDKWSEDEAVAKMVDGLDLCVDRAAAG
jgi:hypothetical protein